MLLTYEQAAKLLDPTGEIGVTVRSIQRHVQAGRLRKVKVGRKPAVLKSEVLDLIERMGENLGPTPPKSRSERIGAFDSNSQRPQRARQSRRIQAALRKERL